MAKRKRYPLELETDFGPTKLESNGNTDEYIMRRGANKDLVVIDDTDAAEGGIAKTKHARILTQTCIDRLFYRNPPLITGRMFESANRYRSLAFRARILNGPRVTNLDGTSGGTPTYNNITDVMLYARQQLSDIQKEVGRAGAQVLFQVVIFDESPGAWEKKQGLQRTTGIGVLRWALGALADYYKLPRGKGIA